MEYVLESLNGHLDSVHDLLRGKLRDELHSRLHSRQRGVLPDKELSILSARAIDLLHSIEQMLEPGPLVLADHFLGKLRAKILTERPTDWNST
jgi:hypothetical protein